MYDDGRTIQRYNVEIKVPIEDPVPLRDRLHTCEALFIGEDRQVDTYFVVPNGRLKIRIGTIECCLVWYNRPTIEGPRQCEYLLRQFEPGDTVASSLRDILAASLGVLVVVDKHREIYRCGQAKIHLDHIEDLGRFAEIEIIGETPDDAPMLHIICEEWLARLGIADRTAIAESYSDILLARTRG